MSGETEDRTLETRLQADFSNAFIAEEGPLAMGFCYLNHIVRKNPFRAAAKAVLMAYRYAQYLFGLRRGEEDLHNVFSIYEGMPVNLLEEAANSLTINPAFVKEVDAHREEHNLEYCVVDLYTRDASCLVDAFVESHKEELEDTGIRIGEVKANHLVEKNGVFTGDSVILVTLKNKLDYINPELPYFVSDQEYKLYHEFLPNIQKISS